MATTIPPKQNGKSIGIIGAGAAGLCALKHAKSMGFSLTVWEQQDDVGGMWIYRPSTGKDRFGIPLNSSIYQNMRANIPKEVMKFPDLEYPNYDESYLPHGEVLKYLKSYSEEYHLKELIKFRHKVEEVEAIPQKDENQSKWQVKVRNLLNGSVSTTTHDYLFICNGHFSIPYIPSIEEIDLFEGKSLHSCDYKKPSVFKNLNVAVLGARISGFEIGLDLSSFAKQVYICSNKTSNTNCSFPDNVQLRPTIKIATKDGFLLQDGTSIEVDAIIYCTGYKYFFPFLNPSCDVRVDETRVNPIYKHMINSSHPSMMFIGLSTNIVSFLVIDIQVRYCLKICSGSVTLPSKKKMDEETECHIKRRKEEGRHRQLHNFEEKFWDYLHELIEEGNLTPLDKYYQLIADRSVALLLTDFSTFRNNKYRVIDSNSFEVETLPH